MIDLDSIALTSTLPRLASLPGVVGTGDWKQTNTAEVWVIELELELVHATPTQHVPAVTDWLLVADFTNDPWGEVKLYPGLGDRAITATFAHQQFNGDKHVSLPCRCGNICTDSWLHGLANSRIAQPSEPVDTIGRIVWHVKRGIEWLEQAASGLLAQPNTAFELPDFRTRHGTPSFDLSYHEGRETMALWEQVGRAGIVELARHTNGLFFTKAYYDQKRKLLYKPSWGTSINNLPTRDALWVRLDSVPTVLESQVPKNYKELLEACRQQNIDISDVLEPMIRQSLRSKEARSTSSILLIGMPIPETSGGLPHLLHWQALELLPSKFLSSGKAFSPLIINRLNSVSPIKWARKCENWAPVELLSRGSLLASLSSKKVLMIGAGSLGSALANQLVRMGVTDMTIVDFDELEGGNLVRHQLNLSDINRNKAEALANMLNLANPSAKVIGMGISINSDDASLKEAVEMATLVIDATADDLTLKTMSDLLAGRNIPVVSCSLGLNANRLFLYADKGDQFKWEEFDRWFHPFRVEEDFMAQQIDLPRGIGCWHPLTPARLNRVEGMAGIAVEYIEQVCMNPSLLPVKIEHKWPDIHI